MSALWFRAGKELRRSPSRFRQTGAEQRGPMTARRGLWTVWSRTDPWAWWRRGNGRAAAVCSPILGFKRKPV